MILTHLLSLGAWLVSDGVPLSGGVSHGPRGPTSYYYMLPMKVRAQGLKVALSSKLAQVSRADHPGQVEASSSSSFCACLQSYLHVVDSLDVPSPDPQYLLELVRLRHWGESVLMVHL